MGKESLRYPFAPIDNGAFLFVTDQGCLYTVEISNRHNKFINDELLRNGGNVFEMSFYRKYFDMDHTIYDASIEATIMHIFCVNVLPKGDTCIFFFVCDTTDGNGKKRARKFNM